MPLVIDPGTTVTGAAVASEFAFCHHWAAYPLAPQLDVNFTRYCPAGSPVSSYLPAWLTV